MTAYPLKPWSYSSLDTFVSCPRKFLHENILKTYPRTPDSPEQLKGKADHTAFEQNQRDNVDLPIHLLHDKPFMDELHTWELVGVERKVGYTKELKPCGFWDKDVWWRGVIDYHGEKPSVSGGRRALIADYKTGKQHQKMEQLKLFAIYAFTEGYDEAEVMFYWTKTHLAQPRVVWPREHMYKLLSGFVPDLNRYVAAHKTGVFNPKRNGLCRNYCPVASCEHHGG